MTKKTPVIEKEVDALTGRLRVLIEKKTPVKARFIWLEEQTKIPNKTWQAWWMRKSIASSTLVNGAGKIWPEHAFWLVTGIDDPQNGHYEPDNDQKNQAAIEYFKLKIAQATSTPYEVDWRIFCEYKEDLSQYKTPHRRYLERIDEKGFYVSETHENAINDHKLIRWLKFPDNLKNIVEISDVRHENEMFKRLRNLLGIDFESFFEHVNGKGYRLKEPYLSQTINFKKQQNLPTKSVDKK